MCSVDVPVCVSKCLSYVSKKKKKRCGYWEGVGGCWIRPVPIVVQNREEANTEGSAGEITEQCTRGTVKRKKKEGEEKEKERRGNVTEKLQKSSTDSFSHTQLWPRSASEIKQEDYTLAERFGSLL